MHRVGINTLRLQVVGQLERRHDHGTHPLRYDNGISEMITVPVRQKDSI